MRRHLLEFKYFDKYAKFLLDNHLNDLVAKDLARSRELKLPLLRFFEGMPEEQILELSKKGIAEYLKQIIDGTIVEAITLGNENWKADKVPGIRREQVVASDLAIIYNVRKHSLFHFIPEFVQQSDEIIDLILEIENYYTFQEEQAIQTFAEISQEEITKREKKLKEAQEFAKLGQWEYDMEVNTVKWSEELYKIYDLSPENGIETEIITSHIFPEDIPAFLEKVQEAYTMGGTFTHEYRIKKANGEVRYLTDKGYREVQPNGKIFVKGITQDVTERRFAEEERTKLKALVDNSHDFIGLSDMEGNAVYVNEAGQKLVGLSGIEAVRKTKVIEYFPEEDREYILNNIIPIVLEKGSWDGELRFRNFITGELIDVTWNVFLVTDGETKKPVGLGCISQDIREKKKSQEILNKQHQQLQEAQELAHLGSWEWDTISNTVKWTDEMYRLFGYAPNEVEMSFDLYISHLHPDDKERVLSTIQQAYQNHQSYTFEHRIICKDGSTKWIYSKGKVALKIGDQVIKLSGTGMDITDDKKAEEILKLKTEALEASNKELEAFCYTISHDLRSPLRAIDGFGRKLANLYNDKLEVEGQRLLGVVRSNAQQMGILIDSLLEFSRLNRRDLKRHPINAEEQVNAVINAIKQQHPEQRAEFRILPLPEIKGDIELLNQVWHNLIANAVKFSSKTPNPIVEIGSEKRGNQVVLFVKDNGAGFEMDYVDKLFGVFQRLHTAEEFSGTGVGLATVQRIVHRHGGIVWAQGEPNKGATFYFTLPVGQEIKNKPLTLQNKY